MTYTFSHIENFIKPYKYKYNGKEFQDELGLNMYDMDMRQYDPAIARWVVLDPVIHHSMSPYNAFDNNPVFWADPTGADSERTTEELIAGIWNAAQLHGGTYSWQNTSNDDESDSSDEEPPINLFGYYGNEDDKITSGVVAQARKVAKEGDGIYTIFGHGSDQHIGNHKFIGVSDNGAYNKITFEDLMRVANPNLLNDLQQGKEITLILYTCNAGSKDYIDNDGGHVTNSNPIAMKLSKLYPNAKIEAANGYVVSARSSSGAYQIQGVRRNDDTAGSMLTFKNGEIISTRKFNYEGKGNKPATK